MSRGNFIDHHFCYTGLGSGYGSDLAKQLLSNVAYLLIQAGWQSESTSFKGSSATEYYLDVNGTTVPIYLLSDASYSVWEAPLSYTNAEGITKLYVTYNYSTSANGTSYHFDTSNLYKWPSDSRQGNGLSMLYIPPNCQTAQAFKYGATSYSDDGNSIPKLNSSGTKYTYHITTKDNFVSFMLHSSDWSSNTTPQWKGYMFGPLIGELYDENDNTCTYNKYFALSHHKEGGTYFENSGNIANNKTWSCLEPYSFDPTASGNSHIYGGVPWMQWYDASGNVIKCNNTFDVTGSNKGLFQGIGPVLRSLNFSATTEIHYSKILVGNILSSSGNGDAVSGTNLIKGTLDDESLIMVDYFGNPGLSKKYTIGQTFDNGNYVHIGSGICMGWDASNTLGILQDSTNTPYTLYDSDPN